MFVKTILRKLLLKCGNQLYFNQVNSTKSIFFPLRVFAEHFSFLHLQYVPLCSDSTWLSIMYRGPNKAACFHNTLWNNAIHTHGFIGS